MVRKGLMKGFQTNIYDLEEPLPICLLTKATKIPTGPTIDDSKFIPGFTLQKYFTFSMLK